MKRLVILSTKVLVNRQGGIFPLYLTPIGGTSGCCHLNCNDVLSQPSPEALSELDHRRRLVLERCNHGAHDGGLPAPHLRLSVFAGFNCFPFLLFSGFPPSPPLRKPQCPKEGSGPASTVRILCSLSPLLPVLYPSI
jgi:hypothetical protein